MCSLTIYDAVIITGLTKIPAYNGCCGRITKEKTKSYDRYQVSITYIPKVSESKIHQKVVLLKGINLLRWNDWSLFQCIEISQQYKQEYWKPLKRELLRLYKNGSRHLKNAKQCDGFMQNLLNNTYLIDNLIYNSKRTNSGITEYKMECKLVINIKSVQFWDSLSISKNDKYTNKNSNCKSTKKNFQLTPNQLCEIQINNIRSELANCYSDMNLSNDCIDVIISYLFPMQLVFIKVCKHEWHEDWIVNKYRQNYPILLKATKKENSIDFMQTINCKDCQNNRFGSTLISDVYSREDNGEDELEYQLIQAMDESDQVFTDNTMHFISYHLLQSTEKLVDLFEREIWTILELILSRADIGFGIHSPVYGYNDN